MATLLYRAGFCRLLVFDIELGTGSVDETMVSGGRGDCRGAR